MTSYARQIATAKRLIAKAGAKCVWRDLDEGVVLDPLKPWDVTSGGAAASNSVSILFLPNSQSTLAYLRTLSNDPVNVGEDYGLMAAVDFVPTINAAIFDENGAMLLRKVSSVTPLQPDGVPLLYTVRFTVAK